MKKLNTEKADAGANEKIERAVSVACVLVVCEVESPPFSLPFVKNKTRFVLLNLIQVVYLQKRACNEKKGELRALHTAENGSNHYNNRMLARV